MRRNKLAALAAAALAVTAFAACSDDDDDDESPDVETPTDDTGVDTGALTVPTTPTS